MNTSTSREKRRLTIDAADLHYSQLNRMLREAVVGGADTIELRNVAGQRYIGTNLKIPVEVEIHGTPGNDLGAFMDGPRIVVHGNAQDGCGNTMNDGEIIIHGHAGDIVGLSARGGKIFVREGVGYRAAIHMKEYKGKKPALVIGGTAQDFLAEQGPIRPRQRCRQQRLRRSLSQRQQRRMPWLPPLSGNSQSDGRSSRPRQASPTPHAVPSRVHRHSRSSATRSRRGRRRPGARPPGRGQHPNSRRKPRAAALEWRPCRAALPPGEGPRRERRQRIDTPVRQRHGGSRLPGSRTPGRRFAAPALSTLFSNCPKDPTPYSITPA